jgi:hypothetical protein
MRSTAECCGLRHQARSTNYAAVRSGYNARLRIITRSASSAVCGAPHTAEFERELIAERTMVGLAAARTRADGRTAT